MMLRIACAFDRSGLSTFDREHQPGNASLLVLPELFDGGYQKLSNGGSSQAENDALLATFADISKRHRIHLIGGSLALRDNDGKDRNTSVVYSKGTEITRVTKTHLFRPLNDDQYFAPGKPGSVLELAADKGTVRTAVMICYDLRFPEIVRPWFRSGLDLLVVPARWPRVRDDLWRSLLKARAIENQCFTVGVDSRDAEGGGTYAFGPMGQTVFELGPEPQDDDPAWVEFTIDLGAIQSVKQKLDTRRDAVLLNPGNA